jgi:hypothetical protein
MTSQREVTGTGTKPRQGVDARVALQAAWQSERRAATTARKAGDTDAEWHHLERAHILSQPLAGLHLRSHVAMLGTALRTRDGHETLGQVLRLALAAPGSLSGRYPVGNTGGADVSAFQPMAVPEDLRPLLFTLGGAT